MFHNQQYLIHRNVPKASVSSCKICQVTCHTRVVRKQQSKLSEKKLTNLIRYKIPGEIY